MKKICSLILLLFLLLLVGCSNVLNNSKHSENDFMKDVYITEIDKCGIEWSQIQFPIDLNGDVLKQIKPIETNQSAVEIAKNIIEELHREGELFEFILISITHATEVNVWYFEYSIGQRHPDVHDLIDCGVLYVAIEGHKGSLIKAWLDE